MSEPKKVAVLGLGYVGCVTAACLAEIGHSVTGTDRDPNKVEDVLAGRAPFYEPGLAELVARMVAASRLRATTSLVDALQDADIALIAVGTPSEKNGDMNLEQLRRVVEDIRSVLRACPKPLIVAVRSTVLPGTCEEIVSPMFAEFPDVAVVVNPEFLREGSAVQDFREPSLLVVGGDHAAAVHTIADLYAPLGVTPSLVEPRTAEMIKFACNAFHAVKVAFANEIGALCEPLQVDPHQVMQTFCRDARLNISPAYLKPGFAFGGSCLAKDLRALGYRAARLDLKLPLLESALTSNQEHLRRAIQRAIEIPAARIGIIGLAFKENTDDLRDSAVVTLLEYLIGKGRTLRVYDPHIRLNSIYGSNRNFILNAIPHIGRLLEDRIEDLLGWAEWLIVAQQPSLELAGKIRSTGLPILDLASAFSALPATEVQSKSS